MPDPDTGIVMGTPLVLRNVPLSLQEFDAGKPKHRETISENFPNPLPEKQKEDDPGFVMQGDHQTLLWHVGTIVININRISWKTVSNSDAHIHRDEAFTVRIIETYFPCCEKALAAITPTV